MPSKEEIDQQQQLLSAHRRTLATLLAQHATFTSAYAPPQLVAGIAEARAEIRRIKATLRGWGVPVADHSMDDAQMAPPVGSAAPANRIDLMSPGVRGVVRSHIPPTRGERLIASFKKHWLIILINFAFSAAAILLGFALVYAKLVSTGASPDYSFLIFGVLLILGGGWGLYQSDRTRDLTVRVYEEGIEQVQAGKRQFVPWQVVGSITKQASLEQRGDQDYPHFDGYTLHDRTGRLLLTIGTDLANVQDLERRLYEQIVPAALQRARAEYQSIGHITFGVIEVSSKGLKRKQDPEWVPWRMIEQISDDGYTIRLTRSDRTEAQILTSLAQTPNYAVLRAFVDQIGAPVV